MPTYQNPITSIIVENTYTAGTHVLYTCPADRIVTISTIKLNTPNINTVTLTVTRVNPAGVHTIYTFNLAAGDNMVDSSVHFLGQGDVLSLTITDSATVLMYGQQTKGGLTQF